jgi:hypothetical protein
MLTPLSGIVFVLVVEVEVEVEGVLLVLRKHLSCFIISYSLFVTISKRSTHALIIISVNGMPMMANRMQNSLASSDKGDT